MWRAGGFINRSSRSKGLSGRIQSRSVVSETTSKGKSLGPKVLLSCLLLGSAGSAVYYYYHKSALPVNNELEPEQIRHPWDGGEKKDAEVDHNEVRSGTKVATKRSEAAPVHLEDGVDHPWKGGQEQTEQAVQETQEPASVGPVVPPPIVVNEESEAKLEPEQIEELQEEHVVQEAEIQQEELPLQEAAQEQPEQPEQLEQPEQPVEHIQEVVQQEPVQVQHEAVPAQLEQVHEEQLVPEHIQTEELQPEETPAETEVVTPDSEMTTDLAPAVVEALELIQESTRATFEEPLPTIAAVVVDVVEEPRHIGVHGDLAEKQKEEFQTVVKELSDRAQTRVKLLVQLKTIQTLLGMSTEQVDQKLKEFLTLKREQLSVLGDQPEAFSRERIEEGIRTVDAGITDISVFIATKLAEIEPTVAEAIKAKESTEATTVQTLHEVAQSVLKDTIAENTRLQEELVARRLETDNANRKITEGLAGELQEYVHTAIQQYEARVEELAQYLQGQLEDAGYEYNIQYEEKAGDLTDHFQKVLNDFAYQFIQEWEAKSANLAESVNKRYAENMEKLTDLARPVLASADDLSVVALYQQETRQSIEVAYAYFLLHSASEDSKAFPEDFAVIKRAVQSTPLLADVIASISEDEVRSGIPTRKELEESLERISKDEDRKARENQRTSLNPVEWFQKDNKNEQQTGSGLPEERLITLAKNDLRGGSIDTAIQIINQVQSDAFDSWKRQAEARHNLDEAVKIYNSYLQQATTPSNVQQRQKLAQRQLRSQPGEAKN